MPFKSEKQRRWMHANKPKMAKKWEKEEKSVEEDRDYKAEYKKYGSSKKAKKYRAELNQYNRKKGTYGNGDGKDASHKGGKIAGFEKEAINRGRAEKSRLKKETTTTNEGSKAVKAYKEMSSALTTAIYGIKNFRKIVNDGPYDKKIDMLAGALYKFEIDLEKKLRLLVPQMKKISADKRLESVNEAIEPQGNIKKVLDVNKTKTAKKIGGTLVDITTANMMSQVWDKVNDKSKEKMNKMNTRQLTNLILKLWNALGTPRV